MIGFPTLAIVNPTARRGAAGRLWERLEPGARSRFRRLEVCHTRGPGDATELAREWMGREPDGAVLVAGGDGSVHEAVNGLFQSGRPVRLGIVPLGTGNDFARNAGVPGSLDAVWARLGGSGARVDVGRIDASGRDGHPNTRYFLNAASVGVVPRANRLAARVRRLVPGRICYALGGIGALAAPAPGRYRVTSGEATLFAGAALGLTIANGPTFGGGMRISPESRLDDGVLDVVVIGDIGRARALLALSRLYAGSHVRMAGIGVTAAPGPIRIRRDDADMVIESDGEEARAGRELSVSVLPGALTMIN